MNVTDYAMTETTLQHLQGELPPDETAEVVMLLKPYEIGRAFNGCTDPVQCPKTWATEVARQRQALKEFISHYTDDTSGWDLVPEIREAHNHGATMGRLNFGRNLSVNEQPCQWAVYGILLATEPPTDWYVPEGVKIPNEDNT